MNLSQFFNQEKRKEEMKISFPLEDLGKEEVKEASPLSLCVENIGKGKVKLQGRCSLSLETGCDRCLVPVKLKLLLEFARQVYAPGYGTEEEEEEQQQFVDEYELNVNSLIREELQLSWPSKVLCSESCKGICKNCGQNLNEKTCDCDDFVPDIRLANLMDIFEGKQ